MSIEYSHDFRVRFSECAGFGHLKSAAYLTYAHETTLEGHASMGLPLQTYGFQNLSLQAREMYIDYRTPFTYQDDVRVTARISSLTSKDISWDFSLSPSGSTKAGAQIKIKFGLLNLNHKKWIALPQELLYILGAPENIQLETSHPDYPDLPAPPPGAITRQRPVAWREVTPNLTLNLAAYLENLLEVTNQAAAASGWTYQRISDEGFASVIRRQWFRIFEPAVYDEELVLSTWLSPFKPASVTRHVTFRRAADQALLAEAHTLWMVVDLKTGRPIRMPEAWKVDFAAQIA